MGSPIPVTAAVLTEDAVEEFELWGQTVRMSSSSYTKKQPRSSKKQDSREEE